MGRADQQCHRINCLWWESTYFGLCNAIPRRLCPYSLADTACILGFLARINAHQPVLCSVSLAYTSSHDVSDGSHLDKLNNLCLYWTGGSVIM